MDPTATLTIPLLEDAHAEVASAHSTNEIVASRTCPRASCPCLCSSEWPAAGVTASVNPQLPLPLRFCCGRAALCWFGVLLGLLLPLSLCGYLSFSLGGLTRAGLSENALHQTSAFVDTLSFGSRTARTALLPVPDPRAASSSPENQVSQSRTTSRSLSRTPCLADTGGTCRVTSCAKWRGATTCLDGSCTCRPGYCAAEGICHGCMSINVTISNVLRLQTLSGTYTAITNLVANGRPIWRRMSDTNKNLRLSWMWICPYDDRWMITDARAPVAVNETQCAGYVLSPRDETSVTPMNVSGSWIYWDWTEWVLDKDGSHIRLECNDL